MSSYKQRMREEYYQLKDRTTKLKAMLDDWSAGRLSFEPACSPDLLAAQLSTMQTYELILAERSRIENIPLIPPEES